jgi:hypothetical protein
LSPQISLIITRALPFRAESITRGDSATNLFPGVSPCQRNVFFPALLLDADRRDSPFSAEFPEIPGREPAGKRV